MTRHWLDVEAMITLRRQVLNGAGFSTSQKQPSLRHREERSHQNLLPHN
jgi:hypothetical protein